MGNIRRLTVAAFVLAAIAPGVGVMTNARALPVARVAPASDAAGSYIVVLKSGVVRDSVIDRQARALGIVARERFGLALNGYSATLTSAQVRALQLDVAVSFLAPSRTFLTDRPGPAFVNDCDASDLANCQFVVRAIRRVDANNSSAASGDGQGSVPINVAVIDTGSQPSSDLNVVGGTDCVGDGRGPLADPNGHGTMVAGILGAIDNQQFVVGVAPGARIWSVRVLDENSEAEDAQVLCGLDWVAATLHDADPTNDISVVNMSLGGPGADDGNCGATNHDAIHIAVCALTRMGVTIVAGTGNDAAPVEADIPGAYSEVLAVAGMSDGDGTWGGQTPDPCEGYPDDAFAPFSNYATAPTSISHIVTAPAVCVSTLYPSDTAPTPGVATGNGTSYATPSASGVVALCIWSRACAGLSPIQIVHKIVRDATLNAARYRYYGFVGDPLHPRVGKYFGPLIRASLY